MTNPTDRVVIITLVQRWLQWTASDRISVGLPCLAEAGSRLHRLLGKENRSPKNPGSTKTTRHRSENHLRLAPSQPKDGFR